MAEKRKLKPYNVEIREKLSDEEIKQLAEYVREIRGNRSITAFSADCDIHRNTISNMENEKVTHSCARNVLEKLFEHRDKNCKVALNDLLVINHIPPDKDGIKTLNKRELDGSIGFCDYLADELPMSDPKVTEYARLNGSESMFLYNIVVSVNDGIDWYIMNATFLALMYLYSNSRMATLWDQEDELAVNLYRAERMTEDGDGSRRYSVITDNENAYEKYAKRLKKTKHKECVSVIYMKYEHGRVKEMREACCNDPYGKPYEAMVLGKTAES